MASSEKGERTPMTSRVKLFLKHLKKRFIDLLQRLDIKIAIRMTIAALLSLSICLVLDSYFTHPQDLTAGVWCVVASLVVLQTHLGGTYKAIWNRFLGVLIGSSIGAFSALNFGAQPEIMGLAIFTTVILCSFLKISESYRIAALSVVIIMLPWKLHPTSDPWIYAFFRFFDTCVGFGVAILVSHLLWPSQALTKMRLNMADTLNLLRQFFEHLLIPPESSHRSPQILKSLKEEIEENFSQSHTVLGESKVELFVRFAPVGVWSDLMNSQERLWENFRALQNVFNSHLEEIFDENLKQQVRRTVEGIDIALKELSLHLKTGHTSFNFNLLVDLQDTLNQELIRFRSTHTIKSYQLGIVEDYFVFFYQVKQILANLYHFNQLLRRLKSEDKPSALEDE